MLTFNQKMLIILGIVISVVLVIYAISSVEKGIQPQNQGQNQSQDQQINLQWNTDLNSALNSAQKSKKLVFIDFYTDWCGYCKQMDEETFTDPSVKEKFAQKYVLVKINGDQNPDLVSDYKIYGYPTLVILDSNGNEVKRQEGFVTLAEILNIL